MESKEYETFKWCGQLRYKCKGKWDDGSPCEYDTYDLSVMKEHERTIHKLAKAPAQAMPLLFDSSGDRVTKKEDAEEVPAEFSQYRFKK